MKKRASGFSLVELMLTLAIVAILITIAVPSFRNMLLNNRLTSYANRFVAAVHYARSEAVKRRQNVQLVATDATDTDDEWGAGWSITIGATTILTDEAFEGGATLNSTGDIGTFTFGPTGRVDNTDTLDLCDDRSGETGRRLTVSMSGRVSVDSLNCS